MTAQSMTGFGQAVSQSENFVVSVEMKSVNNRFKDIRFKMPSTLNAHEIELKKEIAKIIVGQDDVVDQILLSIFLT